MFLELLARHGKSCSGPWVCLSRSAGPWVCLSHSAGPPESVYHPQQVPESVCHPGQVPGSVCHPVRSLGLSPSANPWVCLSPSPGPWVCLSPSAGPWDCLSHSGRSVSQLVTPALGCPAAWVGKTAVCPLSGLCRLLLRRRAAPRPVGLDVAPLAQHVCRADHWEPQQLSGARCFHSRPGTGAGAWPPLGRSAGAWLWAGPSGGQGRGQGPKCEKDEAGGRGLGVVGVA